MQDECHLLWGDVLGYVWGKKNKQTAVPIMNQKLRQTYYGSVDIMTGDFYIEKAKKGNGVCTIKYIRYLLQLLGKKRILLFWDGATYHKSEEVIDFLTEINAGLEEEDWRVTFVLFAPNAPEQNPVEDIWLKGKNLLRKKFTENDTFAKVKMGDDHG